MTRRGIAVVQLLVLTIMAAVTGSTIYVVHLAADDLTLTAGVAVSLVLLVLLTLVWSSLDLARDRLRT